MDRTGKDVPLYEIKRYTNLRQIIEDRAERLPDKSLFIWMEDRKQAPLGVNGREFLEQVNQYGTWLFSQGYRNEKIALFGENSYEWLLSFFAITCGNNVAVLIDKALPAKDVAKLLLNSESTVVLYSREYADVAEEAVQGIQTKLICLDEIPDILKEGRKLLQEGFLDYGQHQVDDDALAVLVYTSGTTGKSKGVMLTHKSIALDGASSARQVKWTGDSILVLPLHHSYGLTAGIFMPWHHDATIFINRSLRYFVEDMRIARPRTLFLVPLLVENLYAGLWKSLADAGKADDVKRQIEKNRSDQLLDNGKKREMFADVLAGFGGKLEIITSGGAPLNQQLVEGFRDFGIQVLNGYGISECSPIVSVNRDVFEKDGSVGLVLSECEVKIEDPDAAGQGEILVKGSIVMQGYYKDPEETAKVLIDGWFHTGDLGTLDEDHFLTITGRKKNLIILSNGENVSPERIEEKLVQLPAVKEVVVYEKDGMLQAMIYPGDELLAQAGAAKAKDEAWQQVEELNRTQPPYLQIQKISIREKPFVKSSSQKILRNKVFES